MYIYFEIVFYYESFFLFLFFFVNNKIIFIYDFKLFLQTAYYSRPQKNKCIFSS